MSTDNKERGRALAYVASDVPEKNRDHAPAVVRVRLWPEEYAAACAKAHGEGLTVKEWAAGVVLGALT